MPHYPSDSDIGSFPPSTPPLGFHLSGESQCNASSGAAAPPISALLAGPTSRASFFSDLTSDGSWSIDPSLLSAADIPTQARDHLESTPQTTLNREKNSQRHCPAIEVSKVQTWLESNCMTAGDFALFASTSSNAACGATTLALSTSTSRAVSACPDDFMPSPNDLATLDDHSSAYYFPQRPLPSHTISGSGSGNVKKRSQDSMGTDVDTAMLDPSTDISTSIAKRSINAMRPKSPRFDMDSHPQSQFPNSLHRSTSRSDVVGRQSAMLEVPNNWVQQRWLDTDLTMDPEEDDFDGTDPGISMSFGVADAPVAATPAAFDRHVRNLNPRLDQVMVERVIQEQMKRHKRLIELRLKHEAAIVRKSCPSGVRCGVLGHGPNYSLESFASKGNDGPPALFHVLHPPGSKLTNQRQENDSSIPATFPEGIPVPPVTRLPAEFECPLCFQVKRFMKPSDWTKHVHEDVQPFTCTFLNCAEPKSFKRKADWVRHESERHRHLESWRCDVPECWHVCYRKDNFVQHLVREHRLPESRSKAGKSGAKNVVAHDDIVAQLVIKCRVESTKQSVEEPCRFCGVVCNSWKKLTVHLAKHMEQISMPVLELIGHQLPRFENLPIHTGMTAMNSQSQSQSQPQPHSWSMPSPSGGPAISVTNTSGTTDLEHAPPLLQPRARSVSATPQFFNEPAGVDARARQWPDGASSMLRASATSSPYMPVRSHSIPPRSMATTPYSVPEDSFEVEDGMFVGTELTQSGDRQPLQSWRSSVSERLPQLHTSELWQDVLSSQSPPEMTADGSTGTFGSAGAFSSPRNLFDFNASLDADLTAGLTAGLQSFSAQDFSVSAAAIPSDSNEQYQHQQQWFGHGQGRTDKRADGRGGPGRSGYGHHM